MKLVHNKSANHMRKRTLLHIFKVMETKVKIGIFNVAVSMNLDQTFRYTVQYSTVRDWINNII
jgi:hypothetical protein